MISIILSIVSMVAGTYFLNNGHSVFGWVILIISYLNMVYEIIEKLFL